MTESNEVGSRRFWASKRAEREKKEWGRVGERRSLLKKKKRKNVVITEKLGPVSRKRLASL